MADVPPPMLAEAAVPVDRDAQAGGQACFLLPPELAQLGAVDGVAVVVEGPVVRVLDPLLEVLGRVVGDVHLAQQQSAEFDVGHLVAGTDVVDLAQLTAVQDGVERVRSVPCVQVPPCRAAVAMQDNRLPSVQQAGELGDDL